MIEDLLAAMRSHGVLGDVERVADHNVKAGVLSTWEKARLAEAAGTRVGGGHFHTRDTDLARPPVEHRASRSRTNGRVPVGN